MVITEQRKQPVEDVLSDEPQPAEEIRSGWRYVRYYVLGIAGCIAGLFAL